MLVEMMLMTSVFQEHSRPKNCVFGEFWLELSVKCCLLLAKEEGLNWLCDLVAVCHERNHHHGAEGSCVRKVDSWMVAIKSSSGILCETSNNTFVQVERVEGF